MKLTCTLENLKKAVNNTERITGKQITLPILSNILLETEKGRLKFSATNLEVGIVMKIGAKIEEEGKIAIPAKIVSNFVNNLPPENNITLELKEHIVMISSGDYQVKIKGLDAQEFPIIPKLEGEFLLSLSAQKIKASISKLLPCIALNETRPELTGANFLLGENEISLAATDSFRLAEEVVPLESKDKGENYQLFVSKTNSVIIPATTLSETMRIIDPEIERVRIAMSESQIFFEVNEVQIVSRLINGKYPEYKQIMPAKYATRVVLKKEDVLRAVRIASAFTAAKAGEVSFLADSKNKKILIKSQSQETGENETRLSADITGPDQNIVFNPRYILEGINSIFTPQFALLVNSGASPAALKMIDEKNGEVLEGYTYIIMPIKN